MPKVMLVEDDNNLREIYEARLAAEGYVIVSAHDGEEALALAVKERPDLIISDVMMPKISGFDMLDILRTTPETKNTRVIMMTALSQAEDRDRADKLGADRYLVKSQVTLEDVIKVAHEILNDSGQPAAAPAAPASAAIPVTPAAAPVEAPTVVAAPPLEGAAPAAPAPAEEVLVEPPASIANPDAAPAAAAAPAVPTTTVTDVSDTPAAAPAEPAVTPTPTPEPATPAPQPTVSTPPADEPKVEEPKEAPLETPTPSAPPVDEPTSAPAISGSTDDEAPKAEDKPAEAPAAEPIKDELTQTKTEETDVVEKQIQDFVANNPSLTTEATPTENSTPAPAEDKPAGKSIPVIEVPTPEDKPATAPTAPAGEAATEDIPPKPAEEKSPSHKKLVLTPTENALAPSVDLDALLAKEAQNEANEAPATNTVISPTATTATTEAGTTSSADPSDPNQIAL